MKVTGWLIMQSGGDRPYFCTRPPTDYEKKNGAKVFEFELDVPGFDQVDGFIQAKAAAVPIEVDERRAVVLHEPDASEAPTTVEG